VAGPPRAPPASRDPGTRLRRGPDQPRRVVL